MLRKSAHIALLIAIVMALVIAHIRQVRADAPAAGDYAVVIKSFAFSPPVIEVPAGARLTWTNRDATVHTVISSDKSFPASPGLDTGDKYSHVFDKPGTYTYYCSLHPFMLGKVVVQPVR